MNKNLKLRNTNSTFKRRFFMYNFRTDLALERRDIYQKVNNLKQIDGIKSTEEEINEKLKVTRVEILNKPPRRPSRRGVN